MVKSRNTLVGLSLMFLILAVAFSLTIWPGVSLAAKIGFFVLGVGSGVALGGWLATRPKR